ncbi:MAG: dTDP-4-dehydrorhamnose 3,5-epimerase [Planctomycetota bacterium]
MKFLETKLQGVYIIEREPSVDSRGSFCRTFCAKEFEEHNLAVNMVQSNLSVSTEKHTLRGMHYQTEDAYEDKLVQCVRGAILDVIIDLRENSETFGKYVRMELSEANNKMLYVPRGFAHGFLTLENNCYVLYQVSNFYAPDKEQGIRWNDPFFGIEWPAESPILSEKDANHRDFHPIRDVNLQGELL